MEDKQLLWIKAEATSGVDPVAAAVDVVWAENPVFTPKTLAGRVSGDPAMAGLGGVKSYIYGQYGELSFEVAIAPSGTAGTAPKWGKLLLACGWSETLVAVTSVTYSLAANPAAGNTMSIIWRDGRRKHQLSYARGYCTFALDEGKRPVIKFVFRGILTPVADGAVIVHADATWTGWNDVDPISQAKTTFSYNAAAAPFRSLSCDQTDNVIFSDRPNQKQVDIAGARIWTGKMKVGTLLPSVLSFEALANANTLATATLVHGTTAGAISTLSIKAQNDLPTYSTDKGLPVTDVTLELNPSALGVDDQIALVLT